MSYSVITVALDSGKTIEKTIASVLKQEPLPSEYIFIDGGSKDKTLDIINSIDFASRGIKLIIESQKKKNGIYGAINQGIKAVSSDIVFVLHSDDWLEAEAAKTTLAKFAEDPGCEIVLAPAFFHSFEADVYLRRQRPFFLFPFLMPVIHPGAFVARKTYEKYGLYDESYEISADYDFFYRCHKARAHFCEIRKPLVNVRLGGYADAHREKARQETLEIGLKHCRAAIPPILAYLARKASGR